MGYLPHKIEDFNRRTLAKSGVDAEHVELITTIDGRQFTYQQSRKAQMMLFLSKPTDEGFSIEIVEAGMAHYTDVSGPDDNETFLRPWQQEAIVRPPVGVLHRRNYTVEGDALNNARKISVALRINGTPWLGMEAREPGLMGFVRRGANFDIHVVGPDKRDNYRDRLGPSKDTHILYPWQIDALELAK